MKYLSEQDPPILELSRRNLNTLLDKLNDPFSMRMLGSPSAWPGQATIFVKAVEDIEHYSDRPAGEVHMPSGDPFFVLIEAMKDQQHKLCAYGTREGDGKSCDCKFLIPPVATLTKGSEMTGCCEVRVAIQTLLRLHDPVGGG